MSVKGQVISGEFGRILIRQKSDKSLEIGELLIADAGENNVLLQVFELLYGSQISDKNLELISGLKLEENNDLEFMDPNLRNYMLAYLKPLAFICKNSIRLCKTLPSFFSSVREISKEDLSFLDSPKNPLFIGNLRSGSKSLDVPVSLDGKKVFSHHILISGTTGRGKSVLLKNMLWNTIEKDYCGILVLDPHDEYYGRSELGLKDSKNSSRVVYYTSNSPPAGCKSLKINLKLIKPSHFNGVVDFSDPQKQLMNMYFKQFGSKWIEAVVLERKLDVMF